MAPQPEPQHPRRPWTHPATLAIVAALVAAAVLLAFTPAFDAVFVDLDDLALLVDNDMYRGLAPANLRWMFTTTLMGHYQPLTWLSYALDFAAGGLNPEQFHRTSILIHAMNAALVFLLLYRVLALGCAPRPRRPSGWMLTAGAAAGALFWGAHPMRAESVAWVTERRDVLSGFFLLLATLAYLRWAAGVGGTPRSRARYWGTVALLVLSLLSKSWGMSFFVTALLLDIWPLRRLPVEPWRWFTRDRIRVLLEKAPLAALGLAFVLIAGVAQRSAAGAVRTLSEWPLSTRIAQAAYGLVYYTRKTVSPTDLAPQVELPETVNPLAPQYLGCYLAVGAAAVAAWSLRRRAPWLLVALGVYVVTVAPVLGFFQSGDQFVADRYSYLASIPWSALLASAVAVALSRAALPQGRLVAVATAAGAAAWLAALFWMTSVQTLVWRDPLALWSHAASVVPSAGSVSNYGLALQRVGRIDEAIEQMRLSVRLSPHNGRAWFTLAEALKKEVRADEAAGRPADAQRKIVEAEQAYRNACLYMPQAFVAYVNLGSLIEAQRPDEALDLYRRAVDDLNAPRPGSYARRTLSGLPYLRLGMALEKRGDLAGARDAYEHAADPRFPDATAAADARSRLARLDAARR